MAKPDEPNLTWEPVNPDEELAFPPEAGAALASHLAGQTGVPEEQVARVIAALAATACAQLRAHPNRYSRSRASAPSSPSSERVRTRLTPSQRNRSRRRRLPR